MCRECRVRSAFGRPLYHELCRSGLWFKVASPWPHLWWPLTGQGGTDG